MMMMMLMMVRMMMTMTTLIIMMMILKRIVAAINQIGFLFYIRDNHNKTVVLCRASGGVRINLSHL